MKFLKELLFENSISDAFDADVEEIQAILGRKLTHEEEAAAFDEWESGEYGPRELARMIKSNKAHRQPMSPEDEAHYAASDYENY